jgi:hypothetical protein
MKIKNWDKLRYKFIAIAGAHLVIDTTWNEDYPDGTTCYFLTLCDADSVGETLISVQLKEGKMDELYMTVDLPQQKITPNINRVFRRKNLLSVDTFLYDMGSELSKNGMVYSYLRMIADMQSNKIMRAPSANAFSSHSYNPF